VPNSLLSSPQGHALHRRVLVGEFAFRLDVRDGSGGGRAPPWARRWAMAVVRMSRAITSEPHEGIEPSTHALRGPTRERPKRSTSTDATPSCTESTPRPARTRRVMPAVMPAASQSPEHLRVAHGTACSPRTPTRGPGAPAYALARVGAVASSRLLRGGNSLGRLPGDHDGRRGLLRGDACARRRSTAAPDLSVNLLAALV
jgi:hypothetical protein